MNMRSRSICDPLLELLVHRTSWGFGFLAGQWDVLVFYHVLNTLLHCQSGEQDEVEKKNWPVYGYVEDT